MEMILIISLALGAAWAGGLNLYATVLVLGLLEASASIALPASLHMTANPVVMAAAGVLFCLDFVCDKVPRLAGGWNALHSFIRIPGGAVLAAAALAPLGRSAELGGVFVGGALALVSHAGKAGGRALLGRAAKPYGACLYSLVQDAAAVAGILLAVYHPRVFLVLLALFLLAWLWLLPRLWEGMKEVLTALGRILRLPGPPPTPRG